MNYPIHDEVAAKTNDSKLTTYLDHLNALNANFQDSLESLESKASFILVDNEPTAPVELQDRRGGDSDFERSVYDLLDKYEHHISVLRNLIRRLDV